MKRLAWTARALLPLALATAPSARADGADELPPPNTVRVGLYDIMYHVNARDLSGPYVPAGVGLDVQDVQTVYLAYVREFFYHLDLELALGVPPLTKTVGRGPATLGSVPYNGAIISSARWFAPSLVANYVFLSPEHALRPYIGVGINYTSFYDRDSTASGDAASGGPTRLSLSSSVGPVGTVGVTYRIDRRWSLYASYSFSEVQTNLIANTAGVIRTTHVSFGPDALIVAAGFSF
ncbi:MAG TPA: OmpW family outer membrane protein [Steroidobacteraceae bacterium]|jgi:outer membrane protein|nr:OmpW family outer membrane protein [Steroidobacteraceae bacterium]